MRKPNLPSAPLIFHRPEARDDETRPPQPSTTGRFIFSIREGALEDAERILTAANFKIARTVDANGAVLREDEATDIDVLLFPQVEMALLSGEDDQYERVLALSVFQDPTSPILSVSPERVVSHTNAPPRNDRDAFNSLDYRRGYRDALVRLLENAPLFDAPPANREDSATDGIEDRFTWGLQATGVATSRFNGSGIKVAVLDTGLDLTHRDFIGRWKAENNASFVDGVLSVQDGLGHGTHCLGIACGPRAPSVLPRYGVACEAEIFVGKVIRDDRYGAQAWIINGVDWAIRNRCDVVSISIEYSVGIGEAYDPNYERMGQRALANNVLLVAAAGNHSYRPSNLIFPVSAPANCPSIMAVGAVDLNLNVADFSNGAVNVHGGEINLVAPGVSIHSSYLGGYWRDSGTSMATPYVAGIAALIAQADPTARGRRLGDLLVQHARRLPGNVTDLGAGLVLAPQ